MEHHFHIEIAQEVGVNAAVIFHNIYFWCLKNEKNERHFHDGRAWTYVSQKAMLELFPYLSEKMIRTSLDKLKDHDLILDGNFNEKGYDRTKWYAISDRGYDFLKGRIHSPLRANATAPNGGPIPYKKPYKKIKDISPEMKFQGRPSENSDSDNSEKKNLPNDRIKNHHINFSKRILLEQQKRYPTLIKKIDHTKVNNGSMVLEQLERLDGYDFKSEIKPCLLWAIEDDFWSRNILSCAALRQKGKNGESKFTNILNAWQREDKTTPTSRSGGVALPPQNPYPPEATRDFENFLTDPSPKNLAQLYRNLQGIEKWVQGIDLKYYEKHPLVYSQYSRWKNYADKLVEWIMAKGFPTADNIGPYVFDVNGTIWKRFVDQCLLPDVFAKDHIKMKGDRY